MIFACPVASSGLACDAIAIVVSTCPVRTAAIMFPIVCKGRSVIDLSSTPSCAATWPAM